MHMVIILISFISLISRFIFKSRTDPEHFSPPSNEREKEAVLEDWNISSEEKKNTEKQTKNTNPILDHKILNFPRSSKQ